MLIFKIARQLIGLRYLLQNNQWIDSIDAVEQGNASPRGWLKGQIREGMQRLERYGRRKGYFGFEKGSQGEKHRKIGRKWMEREAEKVLSLTKTVCVSGLSFFSHSR